jgi:hypothetical protein
MRPCGYRAEKSNRRSNHPLPWLTTAKYPRNHNPRVGGSNPSSGMAQSPISQCLRGYTRNRPQRRESYFRAGRGWPGCGKVQPKYNGLPRVLPRMADIAKPRDIQRARVVLVVGGNAPRNPTPCTGVGLAHLAEPHRVIHGLPCLDLARVLRCRPTLVAAGSTRLANRLQPVRAPG